MTTPRTEDVARLREAFELHYDALFAYALRRCANRDDAEEIVASTFATAWRRIDQLPAEPLTITWLYQVAWKTLANHYRSVHRRSNLFGRLSGLRTPEQEDPATAFESDQVRAALARLRPIEQEVLRLVTWEELSYTEAAAVLGCTPNAFAIRLHRARAALRAELSAIDGDEATGGFTADGPKGDDDA